MIDEAVLNDVRAVAAARKGCGGRKQAGITQRSLQSLHDMMIIMCIIW